MYAHFFFKYYLYGYKFNSSFEELVKNEINFSSPIDDRLGFSRLPPKLSPISDQKEYPELSISEQQKNPKKSRNQDKNDLSKEKSWNTISNIEGEASNVSFSETSNIDVEEFDIIEAENLKESNIKPERDIDKGLFDGSPLWK